MTSLRLQAYRQLLFPDTLGNHSIQDYQSRWHEAQHTVKTLFLRLDTQGGALPLEEKAEILLTIFVLLQIGYRNHDLFTRAADMTYDLLPQLAEAADSLEAPNCRPLSVDRCPLSVVNYHLLVHLYQETQDEDLLPAIDHLMSTWKDNTMTEEDHYLQELFQLTETA